MAPAAVKKAPVNVTTQTGTVMAKNVMSEAHGMSKLLAMA
jgi:hypothetical protein